MKSIYKSEKAKKAIMSLYDEKLSSLNIDYVELDIETQFGKTRVIKTGNSKGKPIILFHGINVTFP